MTQQIRVGLSISDRNVCARVAPQVLMHVSNVLGDQVHVQVEANGFLPSSDGAVAIADMLNDVARSIMEQVAREEQVRPVPTEQELAASARIQTAHAQGEDREVLVRREIRQREIDYAVRELVQCGLTQADATEAAEKAVDLAMAGTTGSARRAAAVVMDPRIHSQPAVTAAVNVLRNVAAPQPMHPQDPERRTPVDTGRVSYLAHEQETVAKGARTFPTPQRVLDGRAARKEERAADKRARFNPKPTR